MLFYFMIAFEDTKVRGKYESNLIFKPCSFLQKITVNHNISSNPLIVFSFDEVRPKNESLQQIFLRKLQVKVQNLIKKNSVFSKIENDLQLRSLKDQMSVNQSLSKDYERVWTLARKWVRARTITPVNASELGSVLSALQTAPILASDVSRKGTQLKLLLTLAGGEKKKQFALFKPKRYPRDYITDDIYSGADRHNGEVFGMLFSADSLFNHNNTFSSSSSLSSSENSRTSIRADSCLSCGARVHGDQEVGQWGFA